MWQHILAEENMIFSVAIAVMLFLAIIEGIAILFGTGVSSAMDSMMPEMDITPAADIPDTDFGSILNRFLGWLRIGEVPVYMLLVIALTSFGLLGLVFQAVMINTAGFYLPGWLAGIPVFIVTLFMLRLWGKLLQAIMPRDETSAVSADSLIGRVAVITLGVAGKGSPAEARTQDIHGQTHYFQVEPDNDEETFSSGTEVLLVSRHGHIYRAIPNSNPYLSDSR